MSQELKPPHLVEKLKHECSFCGKEFYWNEESMWFGNYKVHGVGYSAWEEENIQAKACSGICVDAMKVVYGKID